MKCSGGKHKWTVKILRTNLDPDGTFNFKEPFEFRPVELSAQSNRGKYDYCRVRVSQEVSREMKPHTAHPDGALSGRKIAQVCYDGNPQSTYLFKPEWVSYGHEFSTIELHDIHKAMDDGIVDYSTTTTLKDHYAKIVANVDNGFVTSVDEDTWAIPPWKYSEPIPTSAAYAFNPSPNKPLARGEIGDGPDELFNAQFAMEFEVTSPQRAIESVNEVFGVRSWFNKNGELRIGIPEANSDQHISARDDNRVWRHKDPSISHPSAPVKQVLVENSGAWEEGEAEASDGKFYVGVARRLDVDSGDSYTISNTKAPTENLPKIAKARLIEEIKTQNKGSVKIDPQKSNGTPGPETLQVGDFVQLLPNDDYFKNPDKTSGEPGDVADYPDKACGDFTYNAKYLVTGVEQRVEDTGRWMVNADVTVRPKISMSASIAVYDPRKDELIEGEEIDQETATDAVNLPFGLDSQLP